MAKIKKLIPGKSYLLKYNTQFSHCVGEKGYKSFSKRMNSGDRIKAIFIGTINSGAYDKPRNIFWSNDKNRAYISFGCDNLKYVKKQIDDITVEKRKL